MKKLVLTIAIVLMMGTTVFAQESGGALRRSKQYQETYRNTMGNHGMRGSGDTPFLPGFGQNDDYDATESPLGSGVAVLLGLGAAYLVGKRRKED